MPESSMNPEVARDKFSEAYEGELPEDERKAFEACLRSDAELREEFDDFRRFMNETRSLSMSEVQMPIDLVGGVQDRIRARSRGRFFRDRYSTRPDKPWVLWIALVMLLVLGSAWAALYYVDLGDEPASAPSSPETP